MRIVAGTARGRKIVAPEGLQVRPTAERVRQATFNALDARGAIEEARVLDLFAGSGAMGFEALSRGAAHATFVEQDRMALKCIKENIDHLDVADQCTIVRSEVNAFVARDNSAFDLVIADPPYTFDGWPLLLAGVIEGLRNDDPEKRGIVVLETPGRLDLGPHWEILRQQKYGGTTVTLAVPAVLDAP